MLKSDPIYKEAQEYKKEKEELEKKLWAETELKALNSKFGLNLSKVEDLDPETVELWNKGLPLDRAYASVNYQKIAETAAKRATIDNGKSHLTPPAGSAGGGQRVEISQEQMRLFKQLNPSATDEDIKNYMNKK